MNHLLVISYFSAEEILRYQVLAEVLAGWPRPTGFTVTALLCSVTTGIEASDELQAAFAKVMPTRTYRCQTQVTGYPARPTAMFWEIMEHVAATDEHDGGFALWFEADMVPTRATWLAELDRAWRGQPNALVLGMVRPRTFIPTSRALIAGHVNGGSCYAKRYAREIPAPLKRGTFDIAPGAHVTQGARAVDTKLIQFGTLAGIERELQGPAAVLHAYRQDKPAFYRRWSELVRALPNAAERARSAEPEGEAGRSNAAERARSAEPGRSSAPGPSTGRCCDLWTRHLFVEYCPLHGPRSTRVKLANAVSVALATPYYSARRRLKKLTTR